MVVKPDSNRRSPSTLDVAWNIATWVNNRNDPPPINWSVLATLQLLDHVHILAVSEFPQDDPSARKSRKTRRTCASRKISVH